MSIDHNRIKVADLEKNLPNKILMTNSDGELEFSETYNIAFNSSAFLWRIGLPATNHFHIVSLTVENARKLVENEASQVFVQSNVVNGHTHELTIEFDPDRNLFFITDISNNDYDNHVTFPLINIEQSDITSGGGSQDLKSVLNRGGIAQFTGDDYTSTFEMSKGLFTTQFANSNYYISTEVFQNLNAFEVRGSHYIDGGEQNKGAFAIREGHVSFSQYNSVGSSQTSLHFNTPVSQSTIKIPSPISNSSQTLAVSVNGNFANENGNIEVSLETTLVNDLTTGGSTNALTAEMGKILKGLIDQLTPPSLQEVIDVNMVANRVEFSKEVLTGGKLSKANGTATAIHSAVGNPLNTEQTYIYGNFEMIDGIASKFLARINKDGTKDETFNVGNGFNAFSFKSCKILVHPTTGKLYITGSFTSYNGVTANRIISLNPDGSINTDFNYGTGFLTTTSDIIFNNEKTHLFISGGSISYNGVSTRNLVKVSLTGEKVPIEDFVLTGTGFNNNTISLLLNPDNTLIVVGYFTQYNGMTCNKICRLLPNGSLDTTFNSGTGFNTGSSATNYVMRNRQGILICWGYFVSYNGTLSNRIIALNDDGSVNNSYDFGTGFNYYVDTIDQLADGKYFVGGGFTEYKGVPSYYSIILNEDFSIYKTFTNNWASYPIVNKLSNLNYFIDLNVPAGTTQYPIIKLDSEYYPVKKTSLTFNKDSGRAEYKIGGLKETTDDELLPKRLIKEMIQNYGYNTYFVDSVSGVNETGQFQNPTKPYLNPAYIMALPDYNINRKIIILN